MRAHCSESFYFNSIAKSDERGGVPESPEMTKTVAGETQRVPCHRKIPPMFSDPMSTQAAKGDGSRETRDVNFFCQGVKLEGSRGRFQ